MEKKLPSSTKVVVIGGGVVGCSVAYHLAKDYFIYHELKKIRKKIIYKMKFNI